MLLKTILFLLFVLTWEKSAHQFKNIDVPVTILRTGVVLTKKNGALSKMNTPLFLSALGTGKQYIPWIHIDDLCNLYLEAILNDNFKGNYNAVAPEHQTNERFTKTLGNIIKKPVLPMKRSIFYFKNCLRRNGIYVTKWKPCFC